MHTSHTKRSGNILCVLCVCVLLCKRKHADIIYLGGVLLILRKYTKEKDTGYCNLYGYVFPLNFWYTEYTPTHLSRLEENI